MFVFLIGLARPEAPGSDVVDYQSDNTDDYDDEQSSLQRDNENDVTAPKTLTEAKPPQTQNYTENAQVGDSVSLRCDLAKPNSKLFNTQVEKSMMSIDCLID